ncbi:hypothetical protein [Streptomyces sp. NPDC048710]|uniref:hypothetical protein n=1 Tax=unclassified Streptomyces TaxID=2593676 RepID=UPI003717963A
MPVIDAAETAAVRGCDEVESFLREPINGACVRRGLRDVAQIFVVQRAISARPARDLMVYDSATVSSTSSCTSEPRHRRLPAHPGVGPECRAACWLPTLGPRTGGELPSHDAEQLLLVVRVQIVDIGGQILDHFGVNCHDRHL